MPGAPHPALDLVEDEERAMGRAQAPGRLQVLGRSRDHSAFALHRLQDHRADLGAVLRELALERRDVVVREVRDAGRIRSETARVLLLAACGHREQRAAVEGVRRRDHADLLRAVAIVRVAAGELQRGLVRLGTGIAEEDALGERRVDEPLGEPQRGLVREPVGDVPELARLLGQRAHQHRMAVAERGDRDAAREVDVHPAVLVPDARAFAADRNERRRRVAGDHPLVEHRARHRHRRGAGGDRVTPGRCGSDGFGRGGGCGHRGPLSAGIAVAATAWISMRYSGAASFASTVARAGVCPGTTHCSHTAFIAAKSPMSGR